MTVCWLASYHLIPMENQNYRVTEALQCQQMVIIWSVIIVVVVVFIAQHTHTYRLMAIFQETQLVDFPLESH